MLIIGSHCSGVMTIMHSLARTGRLTHGSSSGRDLGYSQCKDLPRSLSSSAAAAFVTQPTTVGRKRLNTHRQTFKLNSAFQGYGMIDDEEVKEEEIHTDKTSQVVAGGCTAGRAVAVAAVLVNN